MPTKKDEIEQALQEQEIEIIEIDDILADEAANTEPNIRKKRER